MNFEKSWLHCYYLKSMMQKKKSLLKYAQTPPWIRRNSTTNIDLSVWIIFGKFAGDLTTKSDLLQLFYYSFSDLIIHVHIAFKSFIKILPPKFEFPTKFNYKHDRTFTWIERTIRTDFIGTPNINDSSSSMNNKRMFTYPLEFQ